MTSEVVVMNRLGVALATDSAATVRGDVTKMYHADKLFMLSHHHPVGVMVYQNSTLLGVPWETILKIYRQKRLGTRKFNTLEEYAEDLVNFLDNNAELFPLDVQKHHFLNLVQSLFQEIFDEIEAELLWNYEKGLKTPKDLASLHIQKRLEFWRSKPDVQQYDPNLSGQWIGELSGEISKLTGWRQRSGPLGSAEVNLLFELAKLVVSKDENLEASLSGLVVAGFGETDHFPAVQAYEIGHVFFGRLRCKKFPAERIDGKKRSSIIRPFAQREMAETYLYGISPAFKLHLLKRLETLFVELPDAVVDGFPGIGKKRKDEYKDKVFAEIPPLYKAFLRDLKNHWDEKHGDITNSIASLPKGELAHFASSLVNLNSFQKRMSTRENETVGGPIDVAVISKGDGFVWIERKHYFRPDLNHHFFRNYGIKEKLNEGRDDERHGGEGPVPHSE